MKRLEVLSLFYIIIFFNSFKSRGFYIPKFPITYILNVLLSFKYKVLLETTILKLFDC